MLTNHDELVGLDCISVTACMKNTVGLYALKASPTNAVMVNQVSKLHGCIYPWRGVGVTVKVGHKSENMPQKLFT